MEELDLKELFNIFWSRKAYIFIIVAIFCILGVIYTIGFVKPVYQSTTTLVLAKAAEENEKTNSASITSTDVTLNQKLVSTYSELIKSKNVLRQVMNNLGIDTAQEEELRKNITVTSVKDTELIQIAVDNKEPQKATQIANEIAKVFGEKVAEIYNINNVHVVDEAELPTEPHNINHIKDILIFTFIGIVVAAVYCLIASMLDNTIKEAEDAEKKLGLTVLVSIPQYNQLEGKGGRK